MIALAEGAALFAAVCGTIFWLGRPILLDWTDVAIVFGQGASVSICCIVAFYYNDLYDLRVVRSLGGFASRLLQSFGVALILLAGFYAVFPDTRVTEGAFLSSLLVIVGLLLPIRAVGYAIMRRRAFADRVLILGTGELARKLISAIEARPHFHYEIVGMVDDRPSTGDWPLRYPLLGSPQNVAEIAENTRANRLIVAMQERRGRLPVAQLLALEARGILVDDGLQTYEQLTQKLAIEALTPSLLIFSGRVWKTRLHLALPRLLSLAVAAVGLVLTAPIMALIAVAIKLDSEGPVFFVHERLGLRGRHFKLRKFRTMVPSEETTSEWAHDNDHRITRVGRWLRTYRLDEIPQWINILRGDMNLVGPRPHPVSNYELFIEKIPYYLLRTSVRPGVTGWAQIRYGYANSLEEEIEKMRYDLYYIKHLSFWFDLRILADTVKTVLFGRGSTAPDAYQPDVLAEGSSDALSPSTSIARPGSTSDSASWPVGRQPDTLLPAIPTFADHGSKLDAADETDPWNPRRNGRARRTLDTNEADAGCPAPAESLSSLLTFDIEEWFQVENLRPIFPRANWERVPRRVVAATRVILDLLAERDLRATFFILGWVAERERGLVNDILERGHEIAAHGYGHVLPTQLTSFEFREDVLRARKVLEDLTGKAIVGYRAPSFSLNHEHLEILAECGYKYDSSLHPFTLHDRYARLENLGTPLRPGVYHVNGDIIEVALPVERFGRLQLPISGGGYFRLYPGAFFRQLVRRAIARDGHHILYLHSWEFDPDMPRVKVPGFGSQFRHYNNISRTLLRMRELVAMLDDMDARFLTMSDFVDGLLGPPSIVRDPAADSVAAGVR